jgi:uncharacterized membrane protein
MNVPVRQTSTLAIVSLIFGLLGWSFLPLVGSIVAIITGHMARSEIRAQPDRYEGDSLALVGLVLGYVSIVLAVLLVMGFLLFFGGMAWLATMGQ